MTYLARAHSQNGYVMVRASTADRNAPQDSSASAVAAAERGVFLDGDAALAALEDEDRKIWAMLTAPDVPSGEITPEARRRGDELFVRWCEIIRGMAVIPAESFAGVQVKLRYAISEVAVGPTVEIVELVRSIGQDVERLTGKALGEIRRD
ncbi:MAG: hypothetical protein IIA01_02385 [Proteobacteria bacterium]|nr:hypothetical protein [Pseudomonadota bacterium]